jgi:hypothetical protein
VSIVEDNGDNMVLYLAYRFSELGEVLERASFTPNSTHIATVQDNATRKYCAPEQTNGTQNATATSMDISNAPPNLTDYIIIVSDTHSLNQTKPQEVPNKGTLKGSK